MKTAMKPFSMILPIPAGTDLHSSASAITLLDSAGNTLECNWLKVHALPGGTNQLAGIFFSSLGSNVHDISGTTSAIPGFVIPMDNRGGADYEIFLGDVNRLSEIQVAIVNSNTGVGEAGTIGISFGVKTPINPLRSKDRNTGS